MSGSTAARLPSGPGDASTGRRRRRARLRRGEADLRLVDRPGPASQLQRRRRPAATGRRRGSLRQVGLQVLHDHDEARVAGPIVPGRGGGGQEGHHAALAEAAFDHQRARRCGAGPTRAAPSRPAAASPCGRAKYRSTVTVCKKLFRLPAKMRKMKCSLGLHVGGRLQAVDASSPASASGRGNSPLPSRYSTSLKNFGSELSRRGRTPRRRRRPRTFQASTAEASSRSMFGQIDGRDSSSSGLQAQVARRLDLRPDARAHRPAGRQGPTQVSGVAGLADRRRPAAPARRPADRPTQ